MINKDYRKQYAYSLFKNFDKILTELDLVYTLNHSGEKGRESEEILKSFLKQYLPKKYDITTGFIYSDLGISNQSDIIIYDPNNISPIYSGYVNKIIHIISLRAVIESKMLLNDKKMLLNVNEQFNKLKDFYRKDELVQSMLTEEPITVLFAYKSYSQKENFEDILNSIENKNIDIIFCADKGLYYLNREHNIYTSAIEPNYFYGITTDGYNASKEKHGFAFFYSILLDRMERIKTNYEKYSRIQEFSKSSIYIDYIDK
ncbi:hypothetical protein PTHTG4_27460 [Parageobacillus thermoglucosidasius]|uniref:DUF6602 domain-containing protein n=1 Tax=Parageobacillus thermoglucosidasius TaxID=1426 RepID=UPI000F6170A1|nr:DUF6602 domain-containing protein [Parageobacillus thermoglucosidasius]GCD83682.1 hypothetical protein PTHTG4_27460 [Parageobacillus thermoglucosidasius]